MTAAAPTLDAADVRARLDCRELADTLGVRWAKNGRRGANWKAHCFNADGHAHGDANPSLSVGADAWTCFGCGLEGDAFTLVAELEGLDVRRDFPAVVHRAAALAGLVVLDGAENRPHKPRPRPRRPEPPPRPADAPFGLPLAAVRDLWAHCPSLDDDAEVLAYLTLPPSEGGRGLTPERVRELVVFDEARVLPHWAWLPRWARHGGTPWTAGWRLMVPMYAPAPGFFFDAFDGGGPAVVTLRPRWCRTDTPPPGGRKCPTPRGTTTKGAVMANEGGRILLAHRVNVPLDVVVAEGELDFLNWAARPELAVFGVVSGSWTPALAALVPDGSTVTIRTDNDAAGDKYAATIRDTLIHRCRVLRARPEADDEEA